MLCVNGELKFPRLLRTENSKAVQHQVPGKVYFNIRHWLAVYLQQSTVFCQHSVPARGQNLSFHQQSQVRQKPNSKFYTNHKLQFYAPNLGA